MKMSFYHLLLRLMKSNDNIVLVLGGTKIQFNGNIITCKSCYHMSFDGKFTYLPTFKCTPNNIHEQFDEVFNVSIFG